MKTGKIPMPEESADWRRLIEAHTGCDGKRPARGVAVAREGRKQHARASRFSAAGRMGQYGRVTGVLCLAEQRQPQLIRVFLSSPGDVADERALARRLLKEKLPYDPFLRGHVSFEVVSWDDPASPTPMPATVTPQEAVNRFGRRPSECDVVVVVLWSRLGTHLDLETFSKPDGKPYLSGTEWEFEDAWNAKKRPEILVYWRKEELKIGVEDPKGAEKFQQYYLVKRFFKRFENPDGSLRGGYIPYDTPTAFAELLASHLKQLLRERLDQFRERVDEHDSKKAVAGPAPIGPSSPYPGLRPFRPEEAPIFFGRGREVDALLVRLREPTQRFVAVVGASGSGKSSLVHAGLLPRLKDGALEGSRNWPVLDFTPGEVSDDPFTALAVKLDRALPSGRARRPVDIAKALTDTPERLIEYAAALLAERPADAVVVLFIDQLEELFTTASDNHRRRFIKLLAQAVNDPRLRVLATMRADFLPQGMAHPVLEPLLQAGSFLLGPPGPTALTDMIRRPAEQAGLGLEEGLADQILLDAGGEPGEALPLVAFCLEALYRRTGPSGHRLTLDAYRKMGGLRGAIGRRAGEIFEKLGKSAGIDLDGVLPQVFRRLVHVDAEGKVARQRASRDELMAVAAPVPRLIEALVDGRLLLAEEVGGRASITLAHEALFEEWPALREWVEGNRARMQRIHMQLLNLASPEANDRQHAAETLGRIEPAAAEAVSALAAALRDGNRLVRRAVTEALGRIGPAAVSVLATALRDTDEGIRPAATEALGRIGPAAVPALLDVLRDAERPVRLSAVEALGRIGPAAVSALRDALRDADTEVRRAAAEALRRIGPAAAGDSTAPPIWDLFDLYRSPKDPALAADLDRAEAEAKAFAKRLSGTLAGLSGDAIAAAIAEYGRIEEILGRAISYAQLVYSVDSVDPANGRFYQNVSERVTSISSHLLFFTLELNKLEEAELERKFADGAALGRWRPWLRDLRLFRSHQLSDELERLLHDKETTGRAIWSRVFDETVARIRVSVAGQELTVSSALNWQSDPHRVTRAAAAKALSEALGSHIWLLSLIANTLAKDKEIIDNWRHYPRPGSYRNRANMVEDEIVDALVAAVVESYPRLSHRYYLMKARWLGLPKLQHWDRNAPLPEDDDRPIAWGDAVTSVLEAYRAFSPELAEVAQPFFSRHWIHAAPRPGKAGGAYSHPTVPSVHPYLLLNYHGRSRDAMTLANMLGLGVHQVLAGSQGYLMAGPPLTLAHTASGFSEILTFRAMLDAETDPRWRRLMLAGRVEDTLNTVVRQIAYYRFETLLHDERRKGELSPDRIGEIFLQVQTESLGPAFEFTPDYNVLWAYVPHFVHTPFYVYAYPFGECLANTLYAAYCEGSVPGFERKYIEMLRAGGTKRHRELLAPFGLNVYDPGSWKRGLDVIASFIDELECL
jgi:oligoendopeptidase F